MVGIEKDVLNDVADALPRGVRQYAQDYLTEDRLSHRVLYGTEAYIAELRGYQDRYHPWIDGTREQLEYGCDCNRHKAPCAHVAALILDLTRHSTSYYEIPFAAAMRYTSRPVNPAELGHSFWTLIPDDAPPWRLEPREDHYRKFESILRAASRARYPLVENAAARIFAEADPKWLEVPEFRTRLLEWLEPYLSVPLRHPREWALLQWSQPTLPLSGVWHASHGQTALIEALLGQLTMPEPSLTPSASRRRAMLIALTIVTPQLAQELWPVYDALDPFRQHQADALHLAGKTAEAIRLLENHLPHDAEARSDSRYRLIAWCALDESLPHRLALAWETQSLEVLQPVAHLMSPQQWDDIHQALRE